MLIIGMFLGILQSVINNIKTYYPLLSHGFSLSRHSPGRFPGEGDASPLGRRGNFLGAVEMGIEEWYRRAQGK